MTKVYVDKEFLDPTSNIYWKHSKRMLSDARVCHPYYYERLGPVESVAMENNRLGLGGCGSHRIAAEMNSFEPDEEIWGVPPDPVTQARIATRRASQGIRSISQIRRDLTKKGVPWSLSASTRDLEMLERRADREAKVRSTRETQKVHGAMKPSASAPELSAPFKTKPEKKGEKEEKTRSLGDAVPQPTSPPKLETPRSRIKRMLDKDPLVKVHSFPINMGLPTEKRR